jgi:hypothetical protein
MHSRVTFLSLFAALAAVASSQTCYGLDGTTLDDTFAPCNPSAKHSGCCATIRSSGADICLDNGLCMSTRDETIGMIWQSGCTDATGKDVACPKICPDGMFHRLFGFEIRSNESKSPPSSVYHIQSQHGTSSNATTERTAAAQAPTATAAATTPLHPKSPHPISAPSNRPPSP